MSDAIAAYILAGGRSSRFGSDKARACMPMGQEPLVCQIARVARVVAEPVVIAEKADKYADLGLRTIADLVPGMGPLSGLQRALHDCPHDWLLLLCCDLINPKPQWIQSLLAAPRDQIDVVAFRGQYWEPLCALYSTRLRDEVDHRILQNQLAMQSLLNSVRVHALPLPGDWSQANTPQELQRMTSVKA